MQFTKISDTVVKTTETKVIEKEITKDELLDKIANIDNQIVWLENKKQELLAEKTEIESILSEVNDLWIITKAEWLVLNPPAEV